MKNMKTKIAGLGLYLALFIPLSAHAKQINNLAQLIDYLKETINAMIPLLFGIALIVFIWGVIRYMKAEGPVELKEARNYIIFSILAITIMLSVWGLALMIKNTFFEGVKTPPGSPVGNNVPVVDSGNNLPTGTGGAGSTCYSDAQCDSGYTCNNGICYQ